MKEGGKIKRERPVIGESGKGKKKLFKKRVLVVERQ